MENEISPGRDAKSAALEKLGSKSPHERLGAARKLSRYASVDDLPELERAARRENTAFVRTLLESIVARLGADEAAVDATSDGAEPAPSATDRNSTKSEWKVIERVTGTLLHEILPKLGDIEFEASRELPRYEQSQLKTKIDKLKSLMDGLEDLQSSTSAKRITEFAIFPLISEAVEDQPGSEVVQFGEGDRDLIVVGDPNLVMLAFCNGLRNAIEAGEELDGSNIAVTWGKSDIHYYVNIIDRGPGLSGSEEAALAIGRTTKSGHRGLGLAIARGAMATLDGRITLRPNEPHGTIFAMEWYIP